MNFLFPGPLKITVTALFCSIFTLPDPAAAENDSDWSLSIEAGGEYASNLVVQEIDLDLDSGDVSATLDVSAGYSQKAGDWAQFSLSYDFSQSLHAKHGEYDLQAHIASAGAEFELSEIILSSNYSFVHIGLGGDSLMDMHIFRQGISSLVSDHVYLDASFTLLKKTFDTLGSRDANTHVFGVDAYYFFNQAQSHVVAGIRHESENAEGAVFDYKAWVAHVDLKVPVHILENDSEFKLGLRFTDRDYDALIPALGAERAEKHYQFNTSLSLPISDHLSVVGEYKYISRQSNLPSADYDENLLTLVLKYDF